ncbi:MAG: hypothetical protein R3F14_40060 [Polyangiaceae bacterium]
MTGGAARQRGRGSARALSAAGAFLAASLAFGADAGAGPTVWTRAREPGVSVQDEQVREAQKALLRYRRMRYANGRDTPALVELLLRDARNELSHIVGAGTADFGVRLLYAQILDESQMRDEATEVLKKLLADRPPAPIRADALADLAVLHARAGRREEEIHAYTAALEIEPHGSSRSRLLANRAEALMAMGDVTAAVEGYRAALAPLTKLEMFVSGSTTLFGLGVALDRSGNPEAGMEAVKLARSYEPTDAGLRRSSWFFSPPHDSHWYWALGAWTCARTASLWALRAECYERAIAEWDRYMAAAPPGDPWLPLANVRKAGVERERDRMRKEYERQRKAEAGAHHEDVR